MIVKDIDQSSWDEWVAGRPASVAALCRKLPPDRLYKMRSTGHRVTLYSYSEGGTVSVIVANKYNKRVQMDRNVFGINPDDLEECDLESVENDNDRESANHP